MISVMLGLVLTFVHWGYVFFHCINIEHIPECLVWWHSVPYLGYYFTLGYNPILRFIRCFADFSHCSFYFLIFVGLHTGAYPHLWVYQAFCMLFHCSIYFLIFASRHTGAYPLSLGLPCLVLISWLSDPFFDLYELLPRTSPYHQLVWGIPPLSFLLGHPPTVISFGASPHLYLV